jgi:type I restriction enzyme S subunit
VLRIPNVASGAIDLTDLKYARLPPAEVSRLLLRPGDLLLVRSNGNPELLGRCAVHDSDAPSLFASYLIRARPLAGLSMSTYLQGALSSRSCRALLTRSARTTAGNYNLSAASLRRLRIPCPPAALLDRYLALSIQIRAQRARFERARLESASLFDAVAHRAFQGARAAELLRGERVAPP